MNFGLLDILTVQNASSADLPRKSSNAASKSDSNSGFKNYVKNNPEAKNLSKESSLSRHANIADKKDASENVVINNEGSSQNKSSESSDENKQQYLTGVFNALKGAKYSDNNTLSSLLALQEYGVEDEIIDLNGIEISQISEQQLAEIPHAGIAQLVKELATNANSKIVGEAKTITNLNGSLNINDTSGKALAEININEIASDILDLAKGNIEKPELDQFNLRSEQAQSLLKGLADNKGEKKQTTANSSGNINLANLNSDDFDASKFLNNLENSKDINKETAKQLESNLGLTQKVGSAETLLKNETANTAPELSKVDFGSSLKTDALNFQKLTQTSQTNQNFSSSNGYYTKAEDVLAQVKFGVSNAVQGSKIVTIQLAPKELGNVDIRMETSAEGKTKVSIIAEKTDTLNLLQKESGTLKEMLQDALKTEESQLSFSFHDKNEEKWKHNMENNSNGGRFANAEDGMEEAENNNATYAAYGATLGGNEGLNIMV